MNWEKLRSDEFQAAVERSRGLCVIPIGCVEKHGEHLPLGTDYFEVKTHVELAAEMEEFVIFPISPWLGDMLDVQNLDCKKYNHGSITLSPHTLLTVLEELCEQIGRNGFEKIVICNSHGGNLPWLNTFLRDIMNRKKPYTVCFCRVNIKWAPHGMAELLTEQGSGAIPELTPEDEKLLLDYHAVGMTGGHACMGETALMMGFAPETVHLDRLGIESGLSTHEADYLKDAGVQMVDSGWCVNYPNAYSGHDPVGCNERIGKAAVRLAAEQLAQAFKVIKKDQNLLRWHAKFQEGM
jgi:creatinine amidohydrolase